MLNAIILDDNKRFARMLKEKISEIGKQIHFEMNIKIADSVDEIFDKTLSYDVYFVDIRMPGKTGIELVQQLRENEIDSEVVFVSLYDTFMQESMYVKPGAFVRKDVLDKDLQKAMEVLKSVTIKKQHFVSVPHGKGSVEVQPWKIMYCQSIEHYVKIHYINETTQMVRLKLIDFLDLMADYEFVKTHSRFIVNMAHVDKITDREVILMNGGCIPISKSHQKIVNQYIMESFSK